MPRSSRNPVDVVLAYFETADPAAAAVTLHMASRLVKQRAAAQQAPPIAITLPSPTPKPRRKRGPNKPKPPVPLPLPLPTPVAQG